MGDSRPAAAAATLLPRGDDKFTTPALLLEGALFFLRSSLHCLALSSCSCFFSLLLLPMICLPGDNDGEDDTLNTSGL